MTADDAVRRAAGIFDISHMGRFIVEGAGAARLLASTFSRVLLIATRITGLSPSRLDWSLNATPPATVNFASLLMKVPVIAGACAHRWSRVELSSSTRTRRGVTVVR